MTSDLIPDSPPFRWFVIKSVCLVLSGWHWQMFFIHDGSEEDVNVQQEFEIQTLNQINCKKPLPCLYTAPFCKPRRFFKDLKWLITPLKKPVGSNVRGVLNKTQYFRLRLYWLLFWCSECSLSSLWVLSDCWLIPDWLLEDLSQKDEERALCNRQTDRRTDTHSDTIKLCFEHVL